MAKAKEVEILEAEIIETRDPGTSLEVSVSYKEAIITADFDGMRAALDKMIEPYKGLTAEIVADMPLKDAKQCRANLNKMRKELNDKRIAIGKEYNRPFEEFKAQVDSLIAVIDEPRDLLDAGVKAYERKQKEQRREKLEQLYEEFCPFLVPNVPFERILDPKWLNAGTTEKKAEQELCDKAASIAKDWEVLKSSNLSCPTETEIEFFKTLSVSEALAFDKRHAEEVAKLQELKAQVEPQDPMTMEQEHRPVYPQPETYQEPEPTAAPISKDETLYTFTIEIPKTEFQTNINEATALKNHLALLGIPAKFTKKVKKQEVPNE